MAKNDFDELMSVGVDIGKDVFHLVGFDKSGQLVLRKKIKRMALIATFEDLPHCIVGMEACLSAHFVSRTLRKMGFEPRIIPAIYVKPSKRARRTITTMLRRLPKLPCAPISKQFLRKRRSSLICRHCIACVPGSYRGGRAEMRTNLPFAENAPKTAFRLLGQKRSLSPVTDAYGLALIQR